MMLMITVHTERDSPSSDERAKMRENEKEEMQEVEKIVNYDVSDDNELVCWNQEMNFQYFYLKGFNGDLILQIFGPLMQPFSLKFVLIKTP